MEREEFLNMCFGEIKNSPKCETMGDCLMFKTVDDYCLLTKKVFTLSEDVQPAGKRGELEEPSDVGGVTRRYFEEKPMKAYTEFSGFFIVSKEFKDFFESECPLNSLPAMYKNTFIDVAKKMSDVVRSIDLSNEMLMWNTLLSSTEVDGFGDPIWGDHPNNYVPYCNLFTGTANSLSGKTPTEVHNVLMTAKKCFEDMRDPFSKDYLYCRENCIDVLVSRTLMDELIVSLQLEEYAKMDSCCSNIEICNSGYQMPRLLADGSVSPFMLKRGQFRFVECDMLDQAKFARMVEKDDQGIFGDLLDVDLDKAWIMLFPDRINKYNLFQKHFDEVPGNFISEDRVLARHTKMATYSRGWFDIVSGHGAIMFTGK